MNLKVDHKTKMCCIHVVCIMFIIVCCLWNIRKLDFLAVLNDEFGYWGTAASIAGYNWTDLIRETPYYSFGYSICLVPIMYLLKDPSLMYDAAIGLNVMFLCISYVLSYYIGKKLFPNWNRYLLSFSCMATILFSGNIFYAQIAWSETLLYLLMWVSVAILISMEEKFTYKKAILFVVVLGYTYMVHQRTIGIVIVGAICMAVLMILNKKPICTLFIPLLVLVICIVIQTVFKGMQLDSLWDNSIASATNNVGFDQKTIVGYMGRILYNFKDLIKSVGGKIYYLLVSSILILPVGTSACIKSYKENFKEKKYDKKSYLLNYVFIGGTMLAMLCLCSIQMINAAARKDILVYSRYMENAMGPLMLLSFYGITTNYKKTFKYIILSFSIIIAGTWFVKRNLVDAEGIFNTVCSPGIGAFFVRDPRNAVDAMKYLFITMIVAVSIWLLMLLIKNVKVRNVLIISLLTICWICISSKAYDYILDYRQELADEIEPVRNYIVDNKVEEIYYLRSAETDEYSINPKYLQFMIPDNPIKVIDEMKDLEHEMDEGIILINPNSEFEVEEESLVLETDMLKVYEIK